MKDDLARQQTNVSGGIEMMQMVKTSHGGKKARQAKASLCEEEEVVVHFLRTVHVDGAN